MTVLESALLPKVRSVHDLKTDVVPFQAVLKGVKRFEIRKDDRSYQVGDQVLMREVNPLGQMTGSYISARISYVLRGPSAFAYGIQQGYCAFGISDCVSGEE